ncbi:MAG: hypothetical protein ACRD21_02090 [Vicinamibacteria bacterium]
MFKKRLAAISVLWFAAGIATLAAEEGVAPSAAFEKLKSLAGRWEGHVITPDGPEAVVEYRVSSGGNTVMEFLFPGSDHEMVSIYYLDGNELLAKHFCSMGNQPEMKLDAEASSADELRFGFTGGSNMDPAVDIHIHEGKIALRGDRMEAEWAVYTAGKKEGENRFFLERTKP